MMAVPYSGIEPCWFVLQPAGLLARPKSVLLPAVFLYNCITDGQSDANVWDLELIELVGTWHATVS